MASRFRMEPVGGPDRHDPWLRIGTLDIGSAGLTGVLCAIGLIGYSIAPGIFGVLVLDSYSVAHGQVWRLATWPIPNPPSIWVAISIAILWYFGMQLERTVGRFRFGYFLVALTVLVGVVALVIQLLLYGSAGAQLFGVNELALLVMLTFIAEYPHVRFFFNIPGWVLGLVYVGIQILSFISVGDVVGLLVFVAGMGIAALLAKSIGLLAEVEWLPTIALPRRNRSRSSHPSAGRSKGPRRMHRPTSGKVVKGPWGGSSMEKDQEEFDALLDKISATGMASLTPAEVKRLHALRDRLRGQ